MSKKAFYVRAIWDPDAMTYYTESDIIGLHLESRSLAEIEELVVELGPEMIAANHMTPEELAATPLPDLVPTIVLHLPEPAHA